jgi:hypothetical protein
MLIAWRNLLISLYHRISPIHHPPTPQLTSLENPDRFTLLIPKSSPYISTFTPDTQSIAASDYSGNVELGGMHSIGVVQQRPSYERMTSDDFILPEAHLRGGNDWESERNIHLRATTPTTPLRMHFKGSKLSKFVPTRASNTIQRTKSSKLRGRISTPLPGSFIHVDGPDVKHEPNERTGPYDHV